MRTKNKDVAMSALLGMAIAASVLYFWLPFLVVAAGQVGLLIVFTVIKITRL